MEVVITSVPVEAPGVKLRRKRSEGPKPITAKLAVTSLNYWTEKNGFPACKFYDIDMLYPPDEDIEEYFVKNKADVVGLSAVVSTSYMQVKRLAQIIKKMNPKTLIVCGGYLTAAANTILRKTEVDVCVVGDGEIAWVGILKFMKEHLEVGKNSLNIDKLLEVKGIAVLDDDKNLKFSGYGKRLSNCDMSFPDYKFLKSGLEGDEESFNNYFRPVYKHDDFLFDDRTWEKGRKPNVAATLLTKGCVAKCTFCQRGSKGYSIFDYKKLEAHLKDLKDNYNVGFVALNDENFGSDKEYCYKAAEILNKYNMLWTVNGIRCTSVTKEDLIHYRNNGCVTMKFGVESGSQTILDIMEKKFTVEDVKKAIFTAYDVGLNSHPGAFMVGMPGESIKTAKESGKLMGEIAAHARVPLELQQKYMDLCFALPLVGTPLYEYGKQLGLIGQTVGDEEKYLADTSNVTSLKRYYINFNGAPMSEVLFWDILVFLEAQRTYTKLMKNKTENEVLVKKYKKRAEIHGDNPHVKSKEKKVEIMGGSGFVDDFGISQYFITNFLYEHVIFNKTISKLPRFLVYPIVRYMIYFEYLFQKYIVKDSENIHKNTNKANSKIRISDAAVDPSKTTQKERSLRSIVAKKIAQLQRSEKEKTLSLLTAGP